MADMKIFDGGNSNAFPLDNVMQSDYIGGYPIKYAAHLTNRHKVMPFHIDFGNPQWQVFVRDEMGGEVRKDDTFGTHLLAAGTEITGFALEVRQPSDLDGLKAKIKIKMADDSEEETDSVTLDSPKFHWFDNMDNLRLSKPGIAYVEFEGDDVEEDDNIASSGLCMSVTPAILSYASEYACHCAPAPCDTEYPDPLCSPYASFNSAVGYKDAGRRIPQRDPQPGGDSGADD